MKNKAFTLAEAMIVLSVVSVLAGLSVVAVSNAKPDESIVMFRKGYSTTVRIVNELINDKELYPHAKEPLNSTTSILGNSGTMKGLADLTVTNEMRAKYPCLNNNSLDIPAGKFPNLFIYKANGVIISGNATNKKEMTTPDGISWSVYQYPGTSYLFFSGNDGVMAYVEMNTEANGCQYNASTCRIPTHFKLNIYFDGRIVPVLSNKSLDPMACSYIRYPKINKAKNIPTDPNVNSCFAN